MQTDILPSSVLLLASHEQLPDWSARLGARGIKSNDPGSPIVLVPLSLHLSQLKEIVKIEKEKKPALVVIGIGQLNQVPQLPFVLQENLIDGLIDENGTDDFFLRMLGRAQRLSAQRLNAQEVLLKTKNHNRRLEQLSENLEGEVRERTQTASDSKVEVEHRVSQLRVLLRFMQDLATAVAPEDVLVILRRELKVFHRVREPILAFSLSSGEKRLVYFRGGQVFERAVKKSWPQSLRLRRHDSADSQYLANEFSRPFNPVLAIPLIARKTQSESLQPTLYFEHQLKAHEVDQFLNFLNDRLQVVNVALDRLLLEFDLRSATYLWEHTFDGLEDPVAIVDLDYGLLRSNRAFMAGQRSVTCHKAFDEQNQICSGCPLKPAIQKATPQQGLVRRGKEMFAVHSYPILMDPKDHPTTVVNHYLNVTQDLALHERMIQTEKMAALGHLAGHIAHELNNPLTGIRSLAQVLLADSQLPGQLQDDLREVEAASERSQAIISNLLQFAKADETDQVGKADLALIVKKTLPLLKTALSAHHLQVELGAAEAWTRVAPQLMQQVIFNLLKNACQALKQKGEIRISLQSLSTPKGPFWQLAVRDNGVGISPENMQNLFSPFYTTKAAGEGTGLGLSLSQSFVRRFGGEIEVSSTLGAGTEFRILLPREEKGDH